MEKFCGVHLNAFQDQLVLKFLAFKVFCIQSVSMDGFSFPRFRDLLARFLPRLRTTQIKSNVSIYFCLCLNSCQ